MRRFRIGAARARAATALLVTSAAAQGQFIFAVLRERLVAHILPSIREPRR